MLTLCSLPMFAQHNVGAFFATSLNNKVIQSASRKTTICKDVQIGIKDSKLNRRLKNGRIKNRVN